jgi:hypothetical protein
MPTDRYNGRATDTEAVPAGTTLYRIMRADATWDANSFNAHPKPLGDKTQGPLRADRHDARVRNSRVDREFENLQ